MEAPLGRFCLGACQVPEAAERHQADSPSLQHDYNASQVTPEWHAWLTHVRHDPPTVDPVMQASRQRWQIVRSRPRSTLRRLARLTFRATQPHFENLTGTRGAYKCYNTTKAKVAGWEPKVAQRD